MEYYNKMSIEMANNAAAQKAFEILKETLANGNYDTDYCSAPSIRLPEAIAITGNLLSLDDEDGFYIPEDMMNVAADIFTAIVTELKEEFVCGSAFTDSDYAVSDVAATIDSNNLILKTTYHPAGFVDFLTCEECGEEIVSLEDYDPNKEYVCPECGEPLDLQSQYEELVPQITIKTIAF